jgi:hypothetical protein
MRLILDSSSLNAPFAAIRLFLALLLFARFSERAFPSMLRNKVKSQEANVVCFCIETHDIRCLGITPCRAFVGWRLLSGKSRGSRLLIGETRGGMSIDCTSRLYGQTIEFVELNKSHSRLETRQLTALLVADSFPSHWYSQMGSVLIEAVARCLLNAHLQRETTCKNGKLLQDYFISETMLLRNAPLL